MLKESEIKTAIERTMSLLRQTYHSDPHEKCAGWYHYLDDMKPGVTASAVALYCFHMAKDHFERTEDVLRYLRDKQIISPNEEVSGGWPVRNTIDFPIMEATGWVIMISYLIGANMNSRAPNLEMAYNWIKNNQNVDGGWGAYKGHPSRTFTTVHGVMSLGQINRYSDELSLGIDWLIRHQRQDVPAWGPTPESSPTLLHTSWALLALNEQPGNTNKKIINDSLNWLEENLNPDAFTEVESQAEDYILNFKYLEKELEFQCSLPHFALPISVYTYLKLSKGPIPIKIYHALQNILSSQNENGSWELPRSPARPSIWAVWPFLAALTQALSISIKPNMEVLCFNNDITVYQPENTKYSIQKIIFSSTLTSISHFFKKNYAWIILMVFTIGGFFSVKKGFLNTKEFLLSLIVPIILLILSFVKKK